MRAEEHLFGGDHVGRVQVACERAGLSGVGEIERDRDSDDHDPVELEHVPEPPAEVGVAHRQRSHERRPEPDEPDRDEQVGDPAREQVGAQRAPAEDRKEGEPGAEDSHGGRAVRRRSLREQFRVDEAERAEGDDSGDQDGLEHEQGLDPAHEREPEGREREDQRAGRKGRAAGQHHLAVAGRGEEVSRSRDPVERKQRRHHRERGADQHRARVRKARADPGEDE